MMLEPIPDSPALLLKGRETWVCVADFNVPSQTRRMSEALESLSEAGDNLVILGDVKHRISSLGRAEDREIPPLMARLQASFEKIVVVAGNHDGGLSSALPAHVRAVSGAGTSLEGVGMVHGHVWPSELAMSGDALVMGHMHPSVLLKDSIGAKTNEKCWLRIPMRKKAVSERYGHCPDEVVVVPAFNPLLIGTPINGGRGGPLGPIFRNGLVDEKRVSAYLLDGTNLGRPPMV